MGTDACAISWLMVAEGSPKARRLSAAAARLQVVMWLLLCIHKMPVILLPNPTDIFRTAGHRPCVRQV